MKYITMLLTMFSLSCSMERADWDSGGQAKRAHEEQREEQIDSSVNQIQPNAGRPITNQGQPF